MNDSQPQKYAPFIFSDAEKKRFIAALGDGFGYPERQRLEGYQLPAEVEAGLLRHRAYYHKSSQSEYYDGDEARRFWEESDGDSPPLFEQCPVNFDLSAIRKYFHEQKMSYLGYAKSQRDYARLDRLEPEERANWNQEIYLRALKKTYSKAWYEYHINEQLYFIDEFTAVAIKQSEANAKILVGIAVVKFSVILGRLIEQYYWKFLLEKAAMRGEKFLKPRNRAGIFGLLYGSRTTRFGNPLRDQSGKTTRRNRR